MLIRFPARRTTGRVRYANRREAGTLLAESLTDYADRPDAIVLGLARGGVIVAAAVAEALRLPLDTLVIRKLALPSAPEVAFGAVSALGPDARDPEAEADLGADAVERVVHEQRAEAVRRDRAYRGDRPPLDLTGRVAILVDDGLATGATATAAAQTARALRAAWVVLAVPVGARDTAEVLMEVADEIVCPMALTDFVAVSLWYRAFDQVSDDEVRAALMTGFR
jgi:putative phosphoribosyl transferase